MSARYWDTVTSIYSWWRWFEVKSIDEVFFFCTVQYHSVCLYVLFLPLCFWVSCPDSPSSKVRPSWFLPPGAKLWFNKTACLCFLFWALNIWIFWSWVVHKIWIYAIFGEKKIHCDVKYDSSPGKDLLWRSCTNYSFSDHQTIDR